MTYTADANSLSWGFWEHWADGRWEPETHRIIAEHCHGGTFVDIGAWVGPTSIWAMQSGYSRIVSVEPDPLAAVMLRDNIASAAAGVPDYCYPEIVEAAITDGNGMTTMEKRGDSMGRCGLREEDADHPLVLVPSGTIEMLFRRHRIENVDLIKIDVEGEEARIIPQAAEFLRTVGAPIHLSTHPWDPLDWSVLKHWTVDQLGDDEWLVRP